MDFQVLWSISLPTWRSSFWQAHRDTGHTGQGLNFNYTHSLGRSFFGVNPVLSLELEFLQEGNFMKFLKQQKLKKIIYITHFSLMDYSEMKNPTLGVTQSLRLGVVALYTHFVQAEMSPVQ